MGVIFLTCMLRFEGIVFSTLDNCVHAKHYCMINHLQHRLPIALGRGNLLVRVGGRNRNWCSDSRSSFPHSGFGASWSARSFYVASPQCAAAGAADQADVGRVSSTAATCYLNCKYFVSRMRSCVYVVLCVLCVQLAFVLLLILLL